MDGNSFNYLDNPCSDSDNFKSCLQSKVHKSIDFLMSPQDQQLAFNGYFNPTEHNSLKYSDSNQSKKVLSIISSIMKYSSSKYSDAKQEKQAFPRGLLKSSAEYSYAKYLDLYEDTCSRAKAIDIENPYYENDYTPPELEDNDFILGYSVDPYSEVSRTPPDMEDWEIDSYYDVDSYAKESDSPSEYDWEDDSDDDAAPHQEENYLSPEDDWACNFNYDTHPYNEYSYSYSEYEWAYNADTNSEESDSSPEDDLRYDAIYDVNPYYEENVLLPTNKDKKVFTSVYSNGTVDLSSIKYLNSHQETWSSTGCFRDLDTPHSEDDSHLSEVEDSDFIPGIGVDPYSQEYDSPPLCDWGIDSDCDEENNLNLNSNCDFKPYSEVNKSLNVKNEHSLLLRFYEQLVDDLMEKFSIKTFQICASLQRIRRNHGGIVNGRLPKDTNYCDKSYCLGYLHRYAACHSAMMLDSVSAILNSSPSNVLRTKLNRRQLNVIFLGGGPGNDFVGFLIALYNYRNHLLDLDVTVVDKMSGWSEVFNEIIEKLKQNEVDKAHQIFIDVNITTSYIAADLRNWEEWNTDMKNKLKEADFVFLVKILSHIPNDDKLSVLLNIILYTKPGSLLIYVDQPFPKKIFASVSRFLKPVYKSSKKSYKLKASKFRFGHPNMKKCMAEIRIFERQ